MNREERRRAEREARRSGRPVSSWGARPGVPQGRIASERQYDPSDLARQVQDFTAGTVFAAGATLLYPGEPQPGEDPADTPPPVFVVMINPDTATFTAAPVLRTGLSELDRRGSEQLASALTVESSWAFLTRPDGHALIKLKLDFHAPFQGSARILLLGENYAPFWQYIQPGGMVGITTPDRLQAVASRPGVTLAEGVEACMMIGIASSPGLARIIDAFSWPSDYLKG